MDLSFFQERLPQAFNTYAGAFIDRLPALLTGVFVLGLGYLLANGIRWAVCRVGERTLDPLAQRSGLDRVVARFGGFTAARLVGSIVWWLVILLVILGASEVMGLSLVSRAVEKAFSYLPILLTALSIFVLGIWGSDKVSRLVSQLGNVVELSSGRVVGRILAGILIVFASITALNVAGVDTSLITTNIQIILAGVLLAFGVAYGFAARDVLSNILGSYYGNERFKPGMRVRIGEDEGVIERIDSVSVTIRKHDRLVMIPCKQLVTERIEVLDPVRMEERRPVAETLAKEDHKAPFA
ncbi:MAG: mechanosensitive ion channel [Flavobacteriales bacterium]|nr:MAG: mechanosensitive ion channel [Flavobacteriales bacterium]